MKFGKILMILTGVMMLSNVSLWAHEHDAHEHEEKEMHEHHGAMTPASVWQEIREEENELGETIEAGKLGEVHKIAFEIRDLTKMFLEHSKGQAGVPIGLLMAQVNQVAGIAERLDEYGDANDKAKTEEQFANLKNVLNAIETQYPKGILEHKE